MHYIIEHNSRKILLSKRAGNKVFEEHEKQLYQQIKKIYDYRKCVLDESDKKNVNHINGKVFNYDIC